MSGNVDDLVERWSATDRKHAFLADDHRVIESTASMRALIAERLLAGSPGNEADRDLLNAFGALGRLVAERGGSPTLAAAIVDGALLALGPGPAGGPAPAWVLPARAALAEAFALSRLESAHAEGAARWEYPRCAVGLADGTVAVAAGFPDDDLDALSSWASRVAHDAALAGVRRMVISGSAAAEAALDGAIEIAGITRVPGRPPPIREPRRK
jgi:hypothetical protein